MQMIGSRWDAAEEQMRNIRSWWSGSLYNYTTQFSFGNAMQQDPTRYFAGIVDEVAVWRDRWLTTNEVAELWNNGVGKPANRLSTGLSGLYFNCHLDQTAGANTTNSAGGTSSVIGTSIVNSDWVRGIVPR